MNDNPPTEPAFEEMVNEAKKAIAHKNPQLLSYADQGQIIEELRRGIAYRDIVIDTLTARVETLENLIETLTHERGA